jgi:hypothetical protein
MSESRPVNGLGLLLVVILFYFTLLYSYIVDFQLSITRQPFLKMLKIAEERKVQGKNSRENELKQIDRDAQAIRNAQTT